ncbi:MAG: low-specificity L-threonine aldolase [Desulfuromonadales bacterium]|nr:low-specificity L-threonine aldolase [Desulfuromonadales bacterium]
MRTIDLRSDTVTCPSPEMRAAMAAAEVGDDVYGEDPTVNRLEAFAAERFGCESALFVSSGTQGNLLALLAHCRRGDEYLAGDQAHCYRCEGGGGAVLGGIQPQPLTMEANGTISAERILGAIKPINDHYARTRLLCLENTQAGKVLSLRYHQQMRTLTRQHGLALHLDGARLGNAAVALGIDPAELVATVDSASICLSKGLGAPVGALLCGGRDLIREARHWRKMVGGGMRQAGILAAAGLYSLENNLPRLAHDHALARILAEGLAPLPNLHIDMATVQSNMVFVTVKNNREEALRGYLREQGILVGNYGTLRFVTHLDLHAEDIICVVEACKKFAA